MCGRRSRMRETSARFAGLSSTWSSVTSFASVRAMMSDGSVSSPSTAGFSPIASSKKKRLPFARLALDADDPSHQLDESLGDGEPHPGPFDVGLRAQAL